MSTPDSQRGRREVDGTVPGTGHCDVWTLVREVSLDGIHVGDLKKGP